MSICIFLLILMIIILVVSPRKGAEEEFGGYIYLKPCKRGDEIVAKCVRFWKLLQPLDILNRNLVVILFFDTGNLDLYLENKDREPKLAERYKYEERVEQLKNIKLQNYCFTKKKTGLAVKKYKILRPHKHKLEEYYKLCLFYQNLFMAASNQWTLIKDMKPYIKEGMQLEVFGSTFNTRCKYFGSITELDEPWGRVGNAFEIFEKLRENKPVEWRGIVVPTDIILVNPPSGIGLQYGVVEEILLILGNRHIKIYLHLSNTTYTKIKNELPELQQYIVHSKIALVAYHDGVKKKFKPGREWIELTLQS
jgi:hypothetical protein